MNRDTFLELLDKTLFELEEYYPLDLLTYAKEQIVQSPIPAGKPDHEAWYRWASGKLDDDKIRSQWPKDGHDFLVDFSDIGFGWAQP